MAEKKEKKEWFEEYMEKAEKQRDKQRFDQYMSKADAEIESQPLSSVDQAKISTYFLIWFLLIAVFGAGLLPFLFLSYGVYMMKKQESFAPIKAAAILVFSYLILIGGSVALLISFGILISGRLPQAEGLGLLAVPPASAILFYLTNSYFYSPLKRHQDWVTVNGIFASKPKEQVVRESAPDIIKGEKLKQYSVADELIKWAKLKDDGHITEEQYQAARKKLLKE